MSAGKKKINAAEIVAQIQNGISDTDLMAKYGVSRDGLQRVFNKLISSGLLTTSDLDGRKESSDEDLNLDWDLPQAPTVVPPSASIKEKSSNSSSTEHGHQTLFKCPACKMPQLSAFRVCPQCGVQVDKYAEKLEKQQMLVVEKHQASRRRKYIIAVTIISFLLVSVAIGNWYIARVAKQRLEAGIYEAIVQKKLPVFTYSDLFVSPLLGTVRLDGIASNENGVIWKIEELEVNFSRIYALRSILSKMPKKEVNPFELVNRIVISGPSISVGSVSRKDSIHLMAKSLLLEGTGNPEKFRFSAYLKGPRIDAPALFHQLSLSAEAHSKFSELDNASVAASYDRASGIGKLDTDITSPAFRGTFGTEALIVESNAKKSKITKARLRVSIFDPDLKMAVLNIERTLGQPLPREGQDIVVDVTEALGNMLGS